MSHKPKEETIQVASFCEGEFLAEAIYDESLFPPMQFVRLNGGQIMTEPSFEFEGRHYALPPDPFSMAKEGVVLLPGVPEDYGSQEGLVNDIIKFIHHYIDVPEFWERLCAHYILMTWVYDRFTAVPYLRFMGEPGRGKTRCLQVIGNLCYKAVTAGGSTTSSPLFRLLDIWKGTFLIDEADYKLTDAWSDIVKILNSGYARGCPVLRSEKVGDVYEPKPFDVYGPKIIANRGRFDDAALESRCLTLEMRSLRPRNSIPRQLPYTFEVEARALRNKLLKWRLDNFGKIKVDESKLLSLEPRLTQIGSPIYSVSRDWKFQREFVNFLSEYDRKASQNSALAVVAKVIVDLSGSGDGIQVMDVTNKANIYLDEAQLTSKRTGSLIRSLGIEPVRMKQGFVFSLTPQKREELKAQFGEIEQY